MDKIKELEACERSLREELADVRKRLHDAKVAESGVAVGDIVRGKGDVLGRVCRVDPGFGKAWVVVNPTKKDGTFGIAERNWFSDWARVESGTEGAPK